MNKNNLLNIFSLGLRVTSLGAKFLLFFYIGKKMELAVLADYGIFATLIALSILFIGFDFYSFANKEIIFSDDKENVIQNQILFNLFSYCLVLLISIVLYAINYLSLKLCIVFFILTILEHFSQELYRLLLALKKTVHANFVFLIRNGLWVFVLLFLWLFTGFEQSLINVYLFWMAGTFTSIIIGGYLVQQTVNLKSFRFKLNLDWIKKGLKFSVYFFLATLSFKLIEYLDKFILEQYVSADDLAVYLFYSQLTNVLSITMFTILFSVKYPYLFEYYKLKLTDKYNGLILTMKKGVFGISLAYVLFIFCAINFIFDMMGKPQFSEHITVLYIMLGASVLLNFSLIYHFILYSKNNIKQLFLASLFAVILNIVLNFITIPYYGIAGAAVNSFISMGALLLLKFFYVKRQV